MGAINRHPSCTYTWRQTTIASRAISSAYSRLFAANVLLEDVLLAEFNGSKDSATADEMIQLLIGSVNDLTSAAGLIRLSIDTALANPDDFAEARNRMNPERLAEDWDGIMLPTGSMATVSRIAKELKSNRLATAMRFILRIDELVKLYQPVIAAFHLAHKAAADGILRETLERNGIPLQRSYGALLATMLSFMNEYLIDSLVATQVSFDQRRHPALVAA